MDSQAMRLAAFASAGPAPVWYHGEMTRREAETRLGGTPDGTFLIRDSTSSDGDFVLSASESGRVSHYIVNRQPDGSYIIGEQNFKDLVQIIEFYKRHLLDTTTLTVPLPLDRAAANSSLQPFLFSAEALYNFNAKDAEDLSFRKGEMLNILEKHEVQWWRAQSQLTLQIGCIPANYVKSLEKPALPVRDTPSNLKRSESMMDGPSRSRAPLPPVPAEPAAPAILPRGAGRAPAPAPVAVAEKKPLAPVAERPKFIVCQAILDRVANAYDHTALSFRTGDKIHVVEQNENGLWKGKLVNGDGKIGHFPFTLVELVDSGAYDDDIAALERQFNLEMDEIYGTA